jgi:hypothetical protein
MKNGKMPMRHRLPGYKPRRDQKPNHATSILNLHAKTLVTQLWQDIVQARVLAFFAAKGTTAEKKDP